MHMPEGDPHPSTLHGFRGTRDPERSVTRSRSEMNKKQVKFEDIQPQDIPNPTEDNFPQRCITQLPDGVSHIYYTGNELTNRDSMRVHGTFTTVFKVWKDIAIIPAVRDAMVNIFGQFMDIRLGNSDNRLIHAFTERWCHLTTHGLFYPMRDNCNIDSSHMKSRNVSITHLRMYLTVTADREDDIIIARAFIIFMMGHLWFQTANDTVPLGYLAAVNDLNSAAQYDWGSTILASLYHGLDTAVTIGGAITGFVQLLPYWFYEYCGVGHPIVKEEIKHPAYPRLRAWERGNRRKTNDQTTNLFILGIYHINHRTVETITWEPWLDSTVSETDDVLNAKLLSRKRIPLQVPNGNYEYYLGDRCWKQLEGEVRILLDPPLSMLPHISPTALYEMKQAGFLDFRAGITPVVVTSASEDFSLPESEWDAQRLQKVKDELDIARMQIDSIYHQLYAHEKDAHKIYQGINGDNDFKDRKTYKILTREQRRANLKDDRLNHVESITINIARRTSHNSSLGNSVRSNNLSEDPDDPPIPQFVPQNFELDGSLYEGGTRPIGQKTFRKDLATQKALDEIIASGSSIQTMLMEMRLEKRKEKEERQEEEQKQINNGKPK
ncbi:hypothetical protein GIB67_000201 [Kingdonia uniflora]|uniref:Aminotransferase-like plant mobile domain-containing protein n=1 Tax=Kingdonia uniflora TaxID=39325 RepID=A0A7J7P9K3_9MAGN|nr:hypothetical protein GIB67_000201 [Kingdonia uniflora]